MDSQTMKSSRVTSSASGPGAGEGGCGERDKGRGVSSFLAQSHGQLPPPWGAGRSDFGLRVPGHRGRGPQESRFLSERKKTSWFGHYG